MGTPTTEDTVGEKEELILETDGRFLGLKIRTDLVEKLDLSGNPDEPSIKNPQYSFCWLNEWKDMSSSKGSVTYATASSAKKRVAACSQDDASITHDGLTEAEYEGMLAGVGTVHGG
jgi:hypothetical protein